MPAVPPQLEPGSKFFADLSLEDDAKCWKAVPSQGDTPAHEVYTAPIQKPEIDDRAYRIVRLANGLEAVLVHDPKADKSAASANVAVGHLSDPDDMPGLAHFCEHMSFLGTEQFPKENEYAEYLSKHGGASNAFTASMNTNYYFSVSSNAFAGALERFAGFFHSPLFSPSCTMRELNAVDSENKKNLQNDMWRIFQLNKHLSRPGHPWRKFGTGNKDTLTQAARAMKSSVKGVSSNGIKEKPLLNGVLAGYDSTLATPTTSRVASPVSSVGSANSENEADGGTVGKETRRRLIEWWSKEYCASRMNIALVGKESLDELTHLAASFFSPILNRGQEPTPLILEHPFGPDERGTIIHVKTVMDFYSFEISFPSLYQAPNWRVKPANFLTHLLGHEGPGSLHAYLKNKNWITALYSGPQRLARGFEMIHLRVELTKEGFQHYREAVLACYKYLNLLRLSALPKWIQGEIQTIAALRFRFEEKSSPARYATRLAEYMKDPTPRSVVLSGERLVWDWDEQLVRDTLADMVVENSRVVVMAQDHSTIGKTGPWSHEPRYNTEYTVEKLDDEFFALAREPNDIPELFLPGPNEFIPSNVEVDKKDVFEPLKRPTLVKSTPLTEVWHKKDDQFWVPRAQVSIEIRTPVASSSVRSAVMTKLYAHLVEDELSEYTYDASLAGLDYAFSSTPLGLEIILSGYNDKLHVLAHHVLEKIKNLQFREDRVSVIKDNVRRNLENASLKEAYMQARYYSMYVLSNRQFTMMEMLAEIEGITVDDLSEHLPMLLSQSTFIVLGNGNIRKEDAIQIANMTENILGSAPVPEDQIPRPQSRLLPKACNYVCDISLRNPKQDNGSITYYCYGGNILDDRQRATFLLLAQIIDEPCFNTLRTKEQLGYIVSASVRQMTESIGLEVLVQSGKDTRYVESRVDAFLIHMRGVIETMTDVEFEEQRKGLALKWTEKLKTVNEETSRFWGHIKSGYLDFNRLERDAALLESVTKADVLAIFVEYIDPASPSRSKLSIHMRPQNPPPRKLSLPAAQAFLVSLRAAGVDVNEEEFLALCADEPPVAAVKAHWEGVLREKPNVAADALLGELETHAHAYPAVGQGAVELNPSTVFISDATAFRAGLALSGPAKPVEFRDIPLAKF